MVILEITMIKVAKGVLKAKMLEFFRRVEQTGEELIVTDHNIPVLRVTPIKNGPQSVEKVFGDIKSKVEYFEDINTSTTDEWSEV
jgi:antitoxin (DNA-binding transcriptional repressor) of toxin-antitoxin stability system